MLGAVLFCNVVYNILMFQDVFIHNFDIWEVMISHVTLVIFLNLMYLKF